MFWNLIYAVLLVFVLVFPAHAQKSPMVQCQVGVSVRMVPDYVCDAMLEAFPIISFTPNNRPKWENSLKECARVAGRRLTATYPGAIDTLCFRMWQTNTAHVIDDAKGRHYY